MLSRSAPVIAPGGLVLLHLTSVAYPCVRHGEKRARLCACACHVCMYVSIYMYACRFSISSLITT